MWKLQLNRIRCLYAHMNVKSIYIKRKVTAITDCISGRRDRETDTNPQKFENKCMLEVISLIQTFLDEIFFQTIYFEGHPVSK